MSLLWQTIVDRSIVRVIAHADNARVAVVGAKQ
jgi:hypothetical protein